MIQPEEPENEKERLKDLESYSILDTLPEADYDNLTAIASEICGTHISLVSLVDNKRQWFKSHHGVDINETPKEYAFCAHAINQPQDVLIVQDARKDLRFRDNPLVTGEPYVVFYAGVPLTSEDGFALGTLCVIDNKPRRLSKGQVNSLRALSVQVMKLLELRKKRIDLEYTLEEMKEKNQNLEQFAVVAAHDIKSPLNNISNLTGILLSDYAAMLAPEPQKMIALMKGSADKLRNLVDGLLVYSRSEKMVNEERSIINLEVLKKDIEGLFVIDEKCSIVLNSELKKIIANKTAIEQIIINLVANGIKYNDKGFIEIEIGVSDRGNEYELYVKDNGPGIPADQHENIFKLFEVTLAKDKYGQTGSGIGLATVKKLVQALGGTVRVNSKIGEGATFIFTVKKE